MRSPIVIASIWSWVTKRKVAPSVHLQVLELGAQHLAQLGVEVRQRLVHQEDARLAHDGAADRHALHLAARQPVGLAVEQVLDAQRLGRLGDALARSRPAGSVAQLRLQREGQVLAHRVVRVERVVLEHQRHVALAPRSSRCSPRPRSRSRRRRAARGRRSAAASWSCRRRSARAARRTRRRAMSSDQVARRAARAPKRLVTCSSATWAMSRASRPSDCRCSASKKCVCAGVELAPRPRSPGLRDEAARRARAQVAARRLQVDDVVGAERLDDVRLDRHVAPAPPARATQHASGRMPSDESPAAPAAPPSRGRRARREVEARRRRRAITVDAAAVRRASPGSDVHDRAADELRDEQVRRVLVDLGRACRPAAARRRS